MSYRLNKTDGTLLTELIDGKIDSTTTDITFIGKNYQGFGEILNENFIKLLENFANNSAPSKPIKGQVWFDTVTDRLKVYDGSTFRSTDSSVVSGTAPLEKVVGDIWIDNSKNQVYFWDGIDWILVGPVYTKTQGLSGIKVDTIKDTFGLNKVIVIFYVAGTPLAVLAREAFTPGTEFTGFPSFRIGLNINSSFSTFVFDGIADKALAITDEFGAEFRINDFISATSAAGDDMAGRLRINTNAGLIFGANTNHQLKVTGTNVQFVNNNTNENLEIRLKDSTGDYSAQFFDAANKRVGFFNNSPDATIDKNTGQVPGDADYIEPITEGVVIGTSGDKKNLVVNGDLRVVGDLRVGTVINEDVTSLRVADKNIQLAMPEDSTLLDSSSEFIDDAGLLIETTGGSIKWTYRIGTTAWTTEDNIDIADENGAYMLDGTPLIDKTSIAATVTDAPGLVNIGTLSSISVDNITIDGNKISNTTADLEIESNGPITVTGVSQEIIGVKTPISERAVAQNPVLTESADNAVATKGYVDTEIGAKTLVFGLDVTGFTITINTGAGINNDVLGVLEALVDPVTLPGGTQAVIHGTAIAASGTDTADVNAQLGKSFTAVDSGGTQNVSVLADVSVSPVPITPTFTVTRYTIKFRVVAGTWEHVSTTAYP